MIETAKTLSIILMLAMTSLVYLQNKGSGGNLGKVLQWAVSNAFLVIIIPFVLIGMFLFDLLL